MKYIYLTLIIFLLIPYSAFSEAVKVEGTGITFTPPKEFKPLPKNIMDLKWPSKRAPKFAVGNKNASTTIAYDIKPHMLPQNKLAEAKEAFAKTFSKIIPGIKWIENKIIQKSGQKWIFFEMTSTAVDTDIHNIMLVTGYKGKMLLFNFNSTKQDFPIYEKRLRKSIDSIALP